MKFIASFFSLFCVIFCSCNNETAETIARDSLRPIVTGDDYEHDDSLAAVDCYGKFFSEGSIVDSNINLITAEGTEYTLTKFIEEESIERAYLTIAKKDFDKDSIPELWIRHYTMGAHCCDQWYVFLQQQNGSYKQSSLLTGGNVCVNDSIFIFTLHEALGYFKSCFACGYNDSTKGFVMMREISLRFNKGKFEVVPYSAEDEEQLMKNLQVLHDEGIDALDDMEMDNGIRKEFAMNIAVYYYNHQKDLQLTKALFDKYYTFKDRRIIWKEFTESLKAIKTYNGI